MERDKFEFCSQCGGLVAYAPTTELTREEHEMLLSFRDCDCSCRDFFSDVEEVSDLEHLKMTLCAQYKWAFKEDSRGNDPVRTAARRIHNRILSASSVEEIEAAIREA